MKLLEKLTDFFSKKELPIQSSNPTGYEVGNYDTTDNKKTHEYLEEIRGWVYACVSAISDEIARTPFNLYKVNKNGDVEEVTDHPVLDLLYKVNDFTTQFDFKWMTSAYLESVGEAYWYLEKTNATVENVYFLPPDRVTPIVKDNDIIAYKYKLENNSLKEITIPAENIIMIKYPDPATPSRGLGTLQAVARTVDIDNYAEKWNKKFYENSARPDAVLNVNVDNLSKEQKEQLKESIKKAYQGIEKSHKLMVLFGDMKFDKAGWSHKDMDFEKSQQFTRDKILGVFRVPKSILAQTDQANYAAAKTANYVFSKWTITPKLERIIQQLNEFLLPLFSNTEEMYLDYVSPVVEDRAEMVEYYKAGIQNGFLSPNEIRQMEGLDLLENGDEVYLPANLYPIGTQPTEGAKGIRLKVIKKKKHVTLRQKQLIARNKEGRPLREIKNSLKESIKKQIQEDIKNKRNGKKVIKEEPKTEIITQMTAEEKKEYWEKKDAITEKYEPVLVKILQGYFKKQGKRILRKKKNIDNVIVDFNVNKETKILEAIVESTFYDIYKESGNDTFKFLGLDISMNMNREEVKSYLKLENRKMSKSVNEVTEEKLNKIVAESISSDLTIEETTKKIQTLYVGFSESRAKMIAESESVRYNSAATEQAFIDSEIVEAKEWVINPGACEYCRSLNGKEVKLGESYYDKGDTITGNDGGTLKLNYGTTEHPPLHPNCRCYIAPVISGSKSINNNVNKKINRLNSEAINEIDLTLENLDKKLSEEIKHIVDEKTKSIDKKIDDNKKDLSNQIDKYLNN